MFCGISMQYYYKILGRTNFFAVQRYEIDLQYNMCKINFWAANEWSWLMIDYRWLMIKNQLLMIDKKILIWISFHLKSSNLRKTFCSTACWLIKNLYCEINLIFYILLESCKIHDKIIEWNKCNKLKQYHRMEKTCILGVLCHDYFPYINVPHLLQTLFIQFSTDWFNSKIIVILIVQWYLDIEYKIQRLILHNQK